MRILILTATAVVLFGCASVKETYSQDGRKAYALNCSGTARGWDKCFAAAGEFCGPAGFDVLDRTSEDTAAISGSNRNFFAAKTNERSMVVACKVAGAAAPAQPIQAVSSQATVVPPAPASSPAASTPAPATTPTYLHSPLQQSLQGG